MTVSQDQRVGDAGKSGKQLWDGSQDRRELVLVKKGGLQDDTNERCPRPHPQRHVGHNKFGIADFVGHLDDLRVASHDGNVHFNGLFAQLAVVFEDGRDDVNVVVGDNH